MNENYSELEKRVKELYEELVNIHDNPIFKREAEIKRELARIDQSGEINTLLLTPIEELGFERDLRAKLKQAKLYTFGDLKYASIRTINRIPGIQEKEIEEIMAALRILEYRPL